MNSLLKTLALGAARWILGARGRWISGKAGSGQRIYCANHTSHLDAVLLLAALPEQLKERTRPVAAADYWSAGRLRRYFARSVFRPVLIGRDRCTLNPLGPVFEALRQGDSLIFFPEGTRGPGGSLQELKPGIYRLAREFRLVEIVPVWIENAWRVLPKRSLVPVPARCEVNFGKALFWDGEEEVTAFLGRLRVAIEELRAS